MSINKLITASMESAPAEPMESLACEAIAFTPVEADAELDYCLSATESLLHMGEQLDDLAEADAVENESTARLRQIAAQSVLAPFGDDAAQTMAVDCVSQEGVVETVKSIVKALVDMMKKAGYAIMRFYDQHLSHVGRMEKSFQKLHAQLKKKAKGTPEERELFSSKFSLLQHQGKPTKDVAKQLDEMADYVKNATANDALTAVTDRYNETLDDILNQNWVQQIFNKRTGRKLSHETFSSMALAWNETTRELLDMVATSDVKGYSTFLPLGDVRLVLRDTKITGTEFHAIGKVDVIYPDPGKDIPSVPAPDDKGVIAAAASAIDLSKVLLEKKDAGRQMEKSTNDIASRANKLRVSKELPKEQQEVQAFLLREATRSISRAVTNQQRIDTTIIRTTLKILAATHRYCVDAAANLSEGFKVDTSVKALPAPSN